MRAILTGEAGGVSTSCNASHTIEVATPEYASGDLRVTLHSSQGGGSLTLYGAAGEVLGRLDRTARKVRAHLGLMPKALTAPEYSRLMSLAGAAGCSWTQLAHVVLDQEATMREQDSRLADAQEAAAYWELLADARWKKLRGKRRRIKALRAQVAYLQERVLALEWSEPDPERLVIEHYHWADKTWTRSSAFRGTYTREQADAILAREPDGYFRRAVRA